MQLLWFVHLGSNNININNFILNQGSVQAYGGQGFGWQFFNKIKEGFG